MRNLFSTLTVVIVLAVIWGTIVSAQDAQKEEKGKRSVVEALTAPDRTRQQKEEAQRQQERDLAKLKATYPLTPLSVQIVVSRYQGEKKISSLPYSMSINANSMRWGGRVSQLRMGGQIPIPIGSPPTIDGKPLPGVPTGGGPVQYKDIGTSIDATATSADDGRFQLNITIEDTSVYADDPSLEGGPRVRGMPVFRSFRSNNELMLRDGQSTQFTAATDRVSGEIVRVDVTLTVVK